MITAQEAKKLGVKIYAGLGEGCKQLIENGAVPLDKSDEKKDFKPKKSKAPELSGVSLYIYQRLSKGSLSEKELFSKEYGPVEIMIALTELEIDGIIEVCKGKYKLK